MTAARGERTFALLVGGALAVVFLVWAGFCVAGWTLGTATRSEHRVIHGPVHTLWIHAASADVTVEAAAGRDAIVDGTAQGSLRAPRLSVSVAHSNVAVRGGCDALSFGRCRASITVRVPPGTAVRVHSTSGDMSASGLSGPVELSTSSGDVSASDLSGSVAVHTGSGDVDVHDLAGEAELSTSSGDIDGEGVRTDAVRAHAGSGDVTLLFAAAPGTTEAETGSGDVSLLVPRAGAYAVDAETSSGDRVVGVRNDPAAHSTIRARSGSGDVVVEYGG